MGLNDRLKRLEGERRNRPDWPPCAVCGGYCDLAVRFAEPGATEPAGGICVNRAARMEQYADQRRAFSQHIGRIAFVREPGRRAAEDA